MRAVVPPCGPLPVAPPANIPGAEVVVVDARLVAIWATGKRHRSWIFEFAVERPVCGDVRHVGYGFEASEGQGGDGLLTAMGVADADYTDRNEFGAEAAPRVTLELHPRKRAYTLFGGEGYADAVLIGWRAGSPNGPWTPAK